MALDMHEIQYLTDAQKERYMLLQRFFESEYWPLFRSWAAASANEWTLRQLNAASWDANRVALGARGAFETIGTLEEATDLEFANYAKEAQEALEAEPEEGN